MKITTTNIFRVGITWKLHNPMRLGLVLANCSPHHGTVLLLETPAAMQQYHARATPPRDSYSWHPADGVRGRKQVLWQQIIVEASVSLCRKSEGYVGAS